MDVVNDLPSVLDLATNNGWIDGLDLKYAFMFPTAIAVSTLAISAGIGGAALFAPILLIVFPLMGPEYPLQSASASVAVAILTETFGFSSGCLGYLRRNLIDPEVALQFALISIPIAVLSASFLRLDPLALKTVYSALMLLLSVYFFVGGDTAQEVKVRAANDNDSSDDNVGNENFEAESRRIRYDSDGKEYSYSIGGVVGPLGGVATGLGAVLTGVLGVGIGEVVLPQLLRQGFPVEVAAATSTLTVTLTALSAAVVQLRALTSGDAGWDNVPWNLIQFMIPGVLVGGQVASSMQGKMSQRQLEKGVALLFGLIGVAFSALTYMQHAGQR
jgi:uncharacterized membrane protein YfcA